MSNPAHDEEFFIRAANVEDAPIILGFIKELAAYEQLSHEVVATEDLLRETLFGPSAKAEVVLAWLQARPVGFALYFHNFSTFLGLPGIYLEDLYVKPEFRGRGFGRALLAHLARITEERGCGRLEWAVLDWNEPAIRFYLNLGARAMEGWTVYRMTGESLQKLVQEG
ncbi:MAG: GNAT family N-acetyltransferase [Planctomycetota bacterium]|jgi:GNAT superfamily N-acetyltransferase